MKEFLPFGTYCKSMFYMSNVFLKETIDGICVPQFQLDYICKTTNSSYIKKGEVVS